MNFLKRFVSNLGQQTAPFGFAPDDPEAGYKAGLGYIGDIGANLLANNQGGVDPFANLGASLQQAKSSSTQRNKEAYTAQRLMEEAAMKRQEREQAEAERMQREDFLKSLPPDVQMKARSVPGFLEAYVQATDPNLQQAPELTADMRNFKMAQENPEYAAWLERSGAGGGSLEFGLQPVPLADADGKFIGMGQMSKSGGLFFNGQPVDGVDVRPMSPSDVNMNKETGKMEGRAVGEARGDLPGAEKQAQITIEKVTELETDPNLDAALGWTSYLPDAAVNSNVIDVRSKVDELMGGAFLEARTVLKGGGQITDFESSRAERAYARMERAIQAGDPKVFRSALADFREAINDGVAKLRVSARLPSAEPQSAPSGQNSATYTFNPDTGELE
jgi:hypothetical protein